MLLNTEYYGSIEYNEEDVILFNKGIPGFEDKRKFIILPVENNEVFSILQSIDDTSLGFVIVSPFFVDKNYEFELDDDKLKELKIESIEDIIIMNTVTLNSNIENITANMKAPIVINNKIKLGEQIILSTDRYLIKQPIFRNWIKTLS